MYSVAFDFDLLVQEIQDGSVVPILGSELYVGPDGAALERALARRLADELTLSGIPDSSTPRDVALAHLMAGGSAALLKPKYRRACDAVLATVPEALRQLAEISDFRLYVTTAADDLMERALQDAHRPAQSTGYSLGKGIVEPVPEFGGHPVVCHVLGRMTELFAMTDAEVLEYLGALLSPTHRPQQLFDELSTRNLLFVGCGFPDWLSRLFIRVMKAEPFVRGDRRLKFIADAHVANDATLSQFLRGYELMLYPLGHAVEFVRELHARWRARSTPPPPRLSAPGATLQDGAVFVSFSNRDRETIEKIVAALDNAGIDTWYDKTGIEPGSDWDRMITDNLLRAALFIPFISKHTQELAETPKYFWKEWNLAEARSPYFAPGAKYILPVALDELDAKEARVPESFRKVQWFTLHQRAPTPEFVEYIRTEFRRKQARRP
jgi:hypothetical protein